MATGRSEDSPPRETSAGSAGAHASGSGISGKRFWTLVATGTLFLAVFWSQSLSVPYWQDDYAFLLKARQARLEGKSWLRPFFPDAKVVAWRPLGTETYWRFVEGPLGADVRAAHLLNLILLLASASAVGWLAATLLRLLHCEENAGFGGLCAAMLYGIHGSHFLPAVWAAAANDSVVVLFSALTLRFWLVGSANPTPAANRALALVPVCFTLALFSREIAIVLPALGLLWTLWVWPKSRPSAKGWVVGVLCLAIALAWLLIRQRFTTAPDPAYRIEFGINVPRNTAGLTAFFFNVPREALRFLVQRGSLAAGIWAAVCLLLQVASFALVLRAARDRLSRRSLAILPALFIVGCGPYFFLAWNCYAYYISIGLFPYAILVAISARRTKTILAASVLAVLSSLLSTFGNYALDHPALIARANWTERQVAVLKTLLDPRDGETLSRLYVRVGNRRKFEGLGVAGLAYTLGLKQGNIVVLGPEDRAPRGQPVLIVPAEGDVRLVYPQDG